MGDDLYSRLRSDGDTNDLLASRYEPGEDGFEIMFSQTTPCALCKADGYPFSIDEMIFYRDDDYYVVDAATKKGHDVRNIVSSTDHGRIPSEGERKLFIDRLKDITAGHIGDGEMLVFGSMQSFSDHWHVIASDLEGDDLEHIHDYRRYGVEKGDYELVEERIRTDLAEDLL